MNMSLRLEFVGHENPFIEFRIAECARLRTQLCSRSVVSESGPLLDEEAQVSACARLARIRPVIRSYVQ